jgi:hypothetical protein
VAQLFLVMCFSAPEERPFSIFINAMEVFRSIESAFELCSCCTQFHRPVLSSPNVSRARRAVGLSIPAHPCRSVAQGAWTQQKVQDVGKSWRKGSASNLHAQHGRNKTESRPGEYPVQEGEGRTERPISEAAEVGRCSRARARETKI